MRKLLGVLVVSLVLAACHSSENYKTADGKLVHWQQTAPATHTRTIHLVVPAQYASDGSFMQAINHGVQQARRSPYINMLLDVPNVAPTDCPDRHCILVGRRSMNGGLTSTGWNSDGHIYGLGARIWLDSAPWNQNVLNNAVCHEFFHALGLAHSSDGTQGPCQGTATDTDLANVKAAHAHFDPQLYPSTSSAALTEGAKAPLKLHHERGHTRAEYRAMIP
jgi:hypothetical protein